ncbi:MAG: zf-HC2 domain-containing protein [Thermoanaerobaculia bacterium]
MASQPNCTELLTFVSRYAAGRLADAALAEFEAHLSRCPACVRYLNDLGAILRLAGACAVDPRAMPAEVPPALLAAVAAGLTHEKAHC